MKTFSFYFLFSGFLFGLADRLYSAANDPNIISLGLVGISSTFAVFLYILKPEQN